MAINPKNHNPNMEKPLNNGPSDPLDSHSIKFNKLEGPDLLKPKGLFVFDKDKAVMDSRSSFMSEETNDILDRSARLIRSNLKLSLYVLDLIKRKHIDTVWFWQSVHTESTLDAQRDMYNSSMSEECKINQTEFTLLHIFLVFERKKEDYDNGI